MIRLSRCPVTAYTEDHSLSNSVSNAFGHVSAAFGGAAVTLVGNSYAYTSPTPPNWLGGQTFGNVEASWQVTITLNNPGHEGQSGIFRQPMHAYGSLLADAGGDQGMGSITYEIRIDPIGVNYQGGWTTNGGVYGTPIASLHDFTIDRPYTTIGETFTLTYDVRMGGQTSTDTPNVCEGHGTGNVSLRADPPQLIDPNTNLPMDFTLTSSGGSARSQITAAGTTYAGFSLTNNAPGRFDSTFQMLDGTATTNTDLLVGFVAPLPIKAASDVVDFSGTDGDLQVVQIDWDPGFLDLGPLQYLGLVFIGHPNETKWRSATFGNYNGPPPTFFERAYNPATDFHLGYQGVDTVNHVAWAVINHSGVRSGSAMSAGLKHT